MRARFWLNSVTRKIAGTAPDGSKAFYGEVELNAVQRSTADNTDWAHYTPVGKLTMTVSGEALPWFLEHQGEDIYLDMVAIPEGE